jgi:hypothetical protein
LPANRRVTWRKDSAVNDRGNNGEDLSGGYYDGKTMIKLLDHLDHLNYKTKLKA